MMGSLVGYLATKVGERWARPLAWLLLIVGVALALLLAKTLYDRTLIARHDAERTATIATEDRKADAVAAIERRADDARRTTETAEVKEAIREAQAADLDPRAAYYRCVGLQQAARAGGQPPPDC